MPVIGGAFSCGFSHPQIRKWEQFRGLAQRNKGRKTSYFDGGSPAPCGIDRPRPEVQFDRDQRQRPPRPWTGRNRRINPTQRDRDLGPAYAMRPPASRTELTEVGRGTPMGELLRRYWHPIGLVADATDIPR